MEELSFKEEAAEAKRIRIGTACNSCRHKKIRCDGGRPQCGSCYARGINCVYLRKYTRACVTEDYVKLLENRIKTLEERASKVANTTSQSHFRSIPSLWNTSASSFMHLVESTINEELHAPKLPIEPTIEFKVANNSLHEAEQPDLSGSRILPIKRKADLYITHFLQHIYPLYPVFEKSELMKEYNRLWSAGPNDTTYPLLNLVFTLGAHFERSEETLFFQRARQSLDKDIVNFLFNETRPVSLAYLQSLFLASMFLLMSQQVDACCRLLIIANRASHEYEAENSHLSYTRDKVLFGRIYFSFVSLDRIISSLFGWTLTFKLVPGIVMHPSFRPCEPSDNSPQDQYSETTENLYFFELNSELGDISDDVILQLYHNGQTDVRSTVNRKHMSKLEILSTVLEIEPRISNFQKKHANELLLPNTVRNESSSGVESVGIGTNQRSSHPRWSIVLHVRLLHLKVLLYRPVLLPWPDQNNDAKVDEESLNPLFRSLSVTISKLCVNGALDLIELMWQNEDTCILPHFWYAIYYIYNAAIVMLAALISRKVNVDIMLLESAWDKALELLRVFEKYYESATKCLKKLQAVHEKVLSSPETMLGFFFDDMDL